MTEPTARPLRFALVITRDPLRWRSRLNRLGLDSVEFACARGRALLHCTHPDALIDAAGARVLIGAAHARRARDLSADDAHPGSGWTGNFAAITVDARRATVRLNATSTQWVCHAMRDGAHVIGDDLPGLCALLAPVAPDPEMLVHHLALRRCPAGRTYIDGIRRLTPGQTLCVDADAWTVRLSEPLAGLMPAHPSRTAGSAQRGAYERALETATASCLDEPAMLLLSGGVDSSLIGAMMRAHLPPDVPLRSCSYRVATAEFEPEVGDVLAAQAALGAAHLFVESDLDHYADDLARTIAATAAPVSEEQMPCYLALIEHLAAQGGGPVRILSGEGADDSLGIPGAKRWLQLDIARRIPGARVLAAVAGRALARALPDQAHGLRELAALLPTLKDRLDPLHPANDYGYGNWELLERAFGRARLRAAIGERVAVLDAHTAGRSLTLVEYIHLLDLLNEMSQSEALTTALFARYGLTLRTPYMDSAVIGASFAFDARIRFHHEGQTKWLPRALLRKRGLASLARAQKRHGGFPDRLLRMLKAGPLADRLRALSRPDWLDAAAHRQLLERPDGLSWNMLTWGMFEAWLATVNSAAARRERAPLSASAQDRNPERAFHPVGDSPP